MVSDFDEYFMKSNTKLVNVKWESLSDEQKNLLPLKMIVWISPNFSDIYIDYIMNMCIKHSKNIPYIYFTVKPNKELVFFEEL